MLQCSKQKRRQHKLEMGPGETGRRQIQLSGEINWTGRRKCGKDEI